LLLYFSFPFYVCFLQINSFCFFFEILGIYWRIRNILKYFVDKVLEIYWNKGKKKQVHVMIIHFQEQKVVLHRL
jgi:hypothetical protein